jgi:Lon protease-like protein
MVDMIELPLFPLNTVLFPGMPLGLHIFEDRYKLMIGKCIQERQPFGVVLIKSGMEALGPVAEPHPVGCIAYVTQVQRLEQGRLNIGAMGHERFRILEVDDSLPYLVGQVEKYPLDEGQPEAINRAAGRLRPWVIRYLEAIPQDDEDEELDLEQISKEPIPLAYLAATLLQIPPEEKQPLLATKNASTLLVELRAIYRREVALVKSMVEQVVEDQGSFSLN